MVNNIFEVFPMKIYRFSFLIAFLSNVSLKVINIISISFLNLARVDIEIDIFIQINVAKIVED